MPILEYRCRACGREFELIVLARDERASCPECGSANAERLISAPAVRQRIPGLIKGARAQAAREGHFSNYDRSEKRRLR